MGEDFPPPLPDPQGKGIWIAKEIYVAAVLLNLGMVQTESGYISHYAIYVAFSSFHEDSPHFLASSVINKSWMLGNIYPKSSC